MHSLRSVTEVSLSREPACSHFSSRPRNGCAVFSGFVIRGSGSSGLAGFAPIDSGPPAMMLTARKTLVHVSVAARPAHQLVHHHLLMVPLVPHVLSGLIRVAFADGRVALHRNGEVRRRCVPLSTMLLGLNGAAHRQHDRSHRGEFPIHRDAPLMCKLSLMGKRPNASSKCVAGDGGRSRPARRLVFRAFYRQ